MTAGDRVVLAEGEDIGPEVLTVDTVGQRVRIVIDCGDVSVTMDAPPGIVQHWALDLLAAVAEAQAS